MLHFLDPLSGLGNSCTGDPDNPYVIRLVFSKPSTLDLVPSRKEFTILQICEMVRIRAEHDYCKIRVHALAKLCSSHLDYYLGVALRH